MASASTKARSSVIGIPYDPVKKPDNVGLVEAFEQMDAVAEAISSGMLVRSTKAQLDAITAAAVGTGAWVTNDTTAANNGVYSNTGTAMATVWTRITDIPYGFIRATDAGAGSANAIQATTAITPPATAGQTAFILSIFETNDDDQVTLSLNGETAKPLKTASGNDPQPGDLTAGLTVMLVDLGSQYRLVSDFTGASIQTGAEAARDEILDLLGGIESNLDAFPDSQTFVIGGRDVIYVVDAAGTADSSLAFGTGLRNSSNATDGEGGALGGRYNLAIGIRCMDALTTGMYNVGAGYEVMENVTTGYRNTAYGEASMQTLTTGRRNAGFGHKTLLGYGSPDVGSFYSNTALGYNAMLTVRDTANNNVAIGDSAMNVSFDTDPVTPGVQISAGISGQYNVGIGAGVLPQLETGNNNIVIGGVSGQVLNGGGNNLIIGHGTGGGLATGSGNVIIGGSINSLSGTLASTLIIGAAGVKRIWSDSTSTQLMGTSDAVFFEVMNNVSTVVNRIRITPSATGNGAIIGTFGSDAAISMLFQTRQSSAQATRMTLALGLVIGAPTGGDKGTGTLNATAIYDDNTLLTDLVLDLYIDGSFDAERYSKHPLAKPGAFDTAWFDVRAYGAWWQAEGHLPITGTWANDNEKPSTGELLTRHTGEIELHAIHMAQLAAENDNLKAENAEFKTKLAEIEQLIAELKAA